MWGGAFLFLITLMFAGLAALTTLTGAIRKKPVLVRRGLASGTAVAGLYAVALLGFSAAQPARTIAQGAEKHICELDCHLAYMVTSAQRTADTYAVTMRVRFDETTIGRERGNGQLYPGGRRIQLVDDAGRKYSAVRTKGLEIPLRPAETTQATLEFSVPAGIKVKGLIFEDSDPTKKLLLGSETAPLHKPVLFQLPQG